jgi:type II secretory pathway component PulK
MNHPNLTATARPARTGARRARHRPPQRRGVIFIITLALIVVLSALLLVYAQEMRTEASASANELATARADTVEQGAEQWVMAQCETFTTPLSGNTIASNIGFGQTDLTTIPAAGLVVGDPAKGGGYFWLLSPNPTDDQNYYFGIVDESAKLNLSVATDDQTINLPNMTQEAADCITDWCSTGESPTGSDGAKSSYYEGLGAEAYDCKDTALDTLDELLLVKGVTPALMWGVDLNRDGVIDATEAALPGGSTLSTITINGSSDRRGFANYVTCYTTRIPPGQAATAPAPPRQGIVVQHTVGLVNINTAPEAVLMCLPGLSQSDADSMVAERTQQGVTGANTTTSWASTALGQGKYQLIQPYVTGQSYQYSADIVAVSGDGRAFKRVRIVVDCRTQPAKIEYRKDLTDLGWPLPPDVRTSLRAGQGVPADAQGTTTDTQTSLP